MTGMLGARQPIRTAEAADMFSAGMQYLAGKEYAYAYICFVTSGSDDVPTLFNMALCCYCISWYDECHRLLCDAEKRLQPCHGTRFNDLPRQFAAWELEHSTPFAPMPKGAPGEVATIQVLRLLAETASKLHNYAEARAIASRLGNRYRHINELIIQ